MKTFHIPSGYMPRVIQRLSAAGLYHTTGFYEKGGYVTVKSSDMEAVSKCYQQLCLKMYHITLAE